MNNNEKAKELILASGMLTSVKLSLKNQRQLHDDDQTFIGILNEYEKDFMESSVVEEIAQVYSNYYSDSEIDELIAFYKSNLGQKMIANMPAINDEVLPVIMNFTMAFIQQKVLSEALSNSEG